MISDYTRLINFTAKAGFDAIPSDFDSEFNRVATFSALKAPLLNPTFSGTVVVPALINTTSDAGVAGKTSPAQSTQIYMNTFVTNTKMIFFQATAPLGWTQITNHDDVLLRVANASDGGTGGTTGFVASPLNITASHVLTQGQIPSHSHFYTGNAGAGGYLGGGAGGTFGTKTTTALGGGNGHTHGITWTQKYINMILCNKQ